MPGMRLHQLSATYNSYEDRIKLSINTLEGQQLGLWLTRRFLLRLLPQLQKHDRLLAEGGTEANAAAQSHSPEARLMLAELRRENALKKSDFESAYQPMAEVDGHSDLLITKLNMSHRREKDGLIHTHFHFQQVRPNEAECGIQFDLSPDAYFGLFAVINQALERSGWVKTSARISAKSAPDPKDGLDGLHIL